MNKIKQKILETKRLKELKQQAERADDHFACILADLYLRIKKIQSLADKKDAIYIALQELLEEIKK